MISQTTDAFLCRRRAIHSPLLFINMWVEIIGNHWKVRSISGITLNSWMKEVIMCTKHSSSPSAIGYHWSTSTWLIIKYAPKDVSRGCLNCWSRALPNGIKFNICPDQTVPIIKHALMCIDYAFFLHPHLLLLLQWWYENPFPSVCLVISTNNNTRVQQSFLVFISGINHNSSSVIISNKTPPHHLSRYRPHSEFVWTQLRTNTSPHNLITLCTWDCIEQHIPLSIHVDMMWCGWCASLLLLSVSIYRISFCLPLVWPQNPPRGDKSRRCDSHTFPNKSPTRAPYQYQFSGLRRRGQWITFLYFPEQIKVYIQSPTKSNKHTSRTWMDVGRLLYQSGGLWQSQYLTAGSGLSLWSWWWWEGKQNWLGIMSCKGDLWPREDWLDGDSNNNDFIMWLWSGSCPECDKKTSVKIAERWWHSRNTNFQW